MKALFAYPFCGLGGVETATCTRAATMRRAGVEVDVVLGTAYGRGGHYLGAEPFVRVGLDTQEPRDLRSRESMTRS